MSSLEYIDLFLLAQENKNSKYHVFTFDIANSKNLRFDVYNNIREELYNIILEIFEIIKKLEILNNKSILFYKEFYKNDTGFGFKKK